MKLQSIHHPFFKLHHWAVFHMKPIPLFLVLLLCTLLICGLVFLCIFGYSFVSCTYDEDNGTITLTAKKNIELTSVSFEYERDDLELVSYNHQQIVLRISQPGIQRVVVKYAFYGHAQIAYIYEIHVVTGSTYSVSITQYCNNKIINSWYY